jgi:hypothetical protein
MRENEIGGIVLTTAIQVHRELGPGLLELKCVEKLSNVQKKKLLTYLRLSGKKLGYLLNFGELLMKDGITRVANQLDEKR